MMTAMILGLTIFFFAASLFQLYRLQNKISQSPTLDLSPVLSSITLTDDPLRSREKLDIERWKTLTLLEDHAVKQRYHQANVLLMARVWVQYLGFVTGMILTLVGAVFVLGKMREERTELTVKSQTASGLLSTTSPGLVLATLGTVLMLTTLLTHNQIEVNDGPLYVLLPYATVQKEKVALPEPEDVTGLASTSTGTEKEGETQPNLQPKSEQDNKDLEGILQQYSPPVN